jgi:hypothetical protein
MYAYYDGVKQSLTTDDVNGIQSIYGAYPSNPAGNRSFSSAMNLNGLLTSQLQVALSANQWLDGAADNFYYLMGVPAGGTGSMTVSFQSAALSSVSPKLVIYNSSQQSIASVSLPNTYGAVAQYTVTNVTPGSYYYFKLSAASGAGSVGTYGLLVNFGPYSQNWVQPPNTVVPSQPDKGGGSEAIQPGGVTATGNPFLDQLFNPIVNAWPGSVNQLLKVPSTIQSLKQTIENLAPVKIGNTNVWADALSQLQYQSIRSPFVTHVQTSPAVGQGNGLSGVWYVAPVTTEASHVNDAALAHWEGFRPVGLAMSPVSRWVKNQGNPWRPGPPD